MAKRDPVKKRTRKEQLAGRKARRVVVRRMKAWRKARPPDAVKEGEMLKEEFKHPPIDQAVALPKQVTEAAAIADAYHVPHTMITIVVRALGLAPGVSDQTSRICDGISDSIGIILAQHKLRSGRDSQITISSSHTPKEDHALG